MQVLLEKVLDLLLVLGQPLRRDGDLVSVRVAAFALNTSEFWVGLQPAVCVVGCVAASG